MQCDLERRASISMSRPHSEQNLGLDADGAVYVGSALAAILLQMVDEDAFSLEAVIRSSLIVNKSRSTNKSDRGF